jgi:GWxTD domain-containing protein
MLKRKLRRMKRGYRAKVWFVVALAAGFGAALAAPPRAVAQSVKNLQPRFREWVEKDVAYLLSKEEREVFARLPTDADRDKFIEQFWLARDPTPGTPENEFKEEHYRRIEYANLYFSQQAATDGWRTDRGRVYILLGPPKQRDFHIGHTNLRPFEIWFYSSNTPALPPFFYVLFYQRDNIGDFRMYSPYFDGPEKLVTSYQAQSGRGPALDVIQKAAGREVARTTLTLLPDEPVDWQAASSSLQSDLILATIRNLANHPLYQAELAQKKALLESVTYRLIVAGDALRVLTVPLRGPEGGWNLHYLLRLPRPDSFAVGESGPDRYYYAFNVIARVHDAENKLVYTQERNISRYISKQELDEIKDKVFGYEGVLPVAPGSYKVEFLLTNQIRRTAFRVERSVVVPDPPASGIKVSELVPFSAAERMDPELAGVVPFSAGGVKFTPEPASDLSTVTGRDLKFFYQIWSPEADPQTLRGKKLTAEYAYGRPAVRGDSKTLSEEVSREQFDAGGSLVSGKRIPLEEAPVGNYRLTLTLTEPESSQRTHATLGFLVAPAERGIPAWDVFDEGIVKEEREGRTDYLRGLCAFALGRRGEAATWLRRALGKSPATEEARSLLVDVYFAEGDLAKAADLYAQARFSSETEERTILRLAEALEKSGKAEEAVEALEEGLRVRPRSGPMHLALAAIHRRLGNMEKAAEFERKGRDLMAQTAPGA